MVRSLFVLILGVAFFTSSTSSFAADKEVTLEGTAVCGKCELKKSEKCAVAFLVKKDGKTTTYWFDKDASDKYHGDVCQETKDAKVTGTVKKDGEKMILTITKLEYSKK